MNPTEATAMSGLLGGPAVVGVAALVGYARGVLSGSARNPSAGWITFGIGAVLTAWFVVFLLLSTGGVIHSWKADGEVEPAYVALTASWMVGIGLLTVTVFNARRAARYLSESYRTGEGPQPVRLLRWLFRV
jgi:hypothetical protein